MALANTAEVIDPSEKKSKVRSEEDPQFKTDSTEVSEQAKPFNPESAELGNFSSGSNLTSNDSEVVEVESSHQSSMPSNEKYYDNDEDGEESSQSMISFNFLYYLLQKFKLSNSLGY